MRKITFILSLGFIFIIPWEGVVELPGLGSGAKILGFALTGLWLAMVIHTGRFRKPSLFHIFVIIFVMWNAISIFWSANPDRTLTHTRTWFQLLMMVLILWDLYTTRSAITAGLQAFVLGEYVSVSLAISNFLSGNVYYSHYQRFSPAGQTNPDGFGFILALGIPAAWYLASTSGDSKLSNFLRVLNYAYIPAAFMGIVLSGTRTAMIISMIGMAFGLATLVRVKLVVRVAIFLLLTLALFLMLPYVQTLRSFERFGTTATEITDGDLNNRTNNWAEGLVAFEQHPLVGVGSNMYRSVNYRGKLAHNSYLSVLVELGLVGFGLFGAILTIAGVQSLGQSKWDRLFWLTMLAVWAVGATTLSWEFRKGTWLILSLAVASAAVTNPREAPVAVDQKVDSAQGILRRPQWSLPPQG